jgi:beta-N-acetylhexosaminidase
MNKNHKALREKVSQLFTFSAFGSELDELTSKLITELKPGGLFLGTNCLKQPEQVYRLTRKMQELSLEKGSGEPLFISADFVAGAGCKLKEGAVHFPKNRAIGAVREMELAYESGRITAEESLMMGVNFNYSPVVDVNNNPLNPVIGTHSFGEDPNEVARLGCAVIRGYQEYGLIATAKHFPGHGDTSVDSHEALPVLPFDKNRLDSFELVPFREAIAAGVDAIMVAHVAVPELDPSLTPASLSYELTTRLLREELGFEGLIVTDGLSMKGVTNRYSMEEAGLKALQAGADILLATTNSFDQAVSMIDTIVRAVEEASLTEARIDESLKRIKAAREKYGLTRERFQVHPFHASSLRREDGVRTDEELARKAATPLNGLSRGYVMAAGPGGSAWTLVCDRKCAAFGANLEAALSGLQVRYVDGWQQALQELRSTEGRVIAAIAGSKPIGAGPSAALNEALNRFEQAVWVHFGSEYDLREASVPSLLMYDFAPSLQEAAASYLIRI